MAPEKRSIQSFFAPVAKKPKASEAVEPPPAPVSNAVGASPAKSPGKNASKRPAETAAPGDGLTEAQRQRAELNKQVAMSKQLQRKATEVWEAARNAGETPDLDALLVEQTWRDILEGEFKKEYMSSLKSFLKREWNRREGLPRAR